ncbi:tetratricopeptide repeat protein [Propionivibrio dicarboxylicus]|nr:glycosyltransferase family 41 protein [Propionivibrio dicarboxylicus]
MRVYQLVILFSTFNNISMLSLNVVWRALVARIWVLLGQWLGHKGLHDLAISCFRNGTGGNGRPAAEAGFLLAKALLDRDRNQDAVEACLQVIEKDEGHAGVWCALGAAYRRLAKMELAKNAYEKAILLDSGYAQAWSNLGEWFLVKGNAQDALARCERALVLNPRLLEASNNRVAALYELGRFADAEEAARRAIELHPTEAALHVNMGNVLLHTGKARQAVKSFQRALECNSACLEAHLNLATLFGERHHLGESLLFLEREIAIKGESAQRLAALALAQQAKGDMAGAEESCSKVLKMQPGNVSALITMAGCLSARADHRGANAMQEKALVINPDMPSIYSNIAFNSTYMPELSSAQVYDFHREWARRFERTEKSRSFENSARKGKQPLRIGYVSGDFGTHPVGFLLRDVICHHDSRSFEIHCFSMMRSEGDEITQAIRGSASAWHDVLLTSDDELADLVHETGIDILVDLSGHTAYNRLPTFVMKPAPVQVTWIGYFHSTGLESIDYFITDPSTSPAGCGQLFSETPVWLPHSRFCYSPPSYSPDVAPLPCLNTGYVTFGCFNRIEKLVDPVIAAWKCVLDMVPGSRLLLKAGHLNNERVCDELRSRFLAHGFDIERLVLRGPSSHPLMLSEYSEVDIALDPFPFNGGMTTLEALWMGVPVVTVAGSDVVSRQTISALKNIGLSELAYPDVKSYVRGVVELAHDLTRLSCLRKGLRDRMKASPLLQSELFARDLELLYQRMWDAHLRGEKLPSDIVVRENHALETE